MEVHHHTHHPKKWKEYFWEFFMLFLAVFCGFLAEYQLEHKIERDRVKKYMHDMVENLKYDIERVNANTPSNKEIKASCDSFRYEIKKAIKGQENTNQLYYHFLQSLGSGYGQVAYNRSAITQLKNSGQLRLVKNDSLLKQIIDYYERKIYASDVFRNVLDKESDKLNTITNNTFSTTSFTLFDNISDSTYPTYTQKDAEIDLKNILSSKDLKLLANDKLSLEKLYNAIASFEVALVNYNRFLYLSRESAKKLIAQINEEYHFGD